MKRFCLVVWIIGFMATYPALLAEFQHIGDDIVTPEQISDFRNKHCRGDMGIAMLFSLLPPAWVAAPFITGFYEHGLQFTCGKEPRP